MAKMQLNDDGTITFPLKGRPPITLDEPSMDQMAALTDQSQKVDGGMIDLPIISDDSTPEVLADFNEKLIERTAVMFGDTHPYGDVTLQMANDLKIGDDEAPVESGHLYAWAMSPRTVRLMLEHWRSPLPGPASQPT